MWSTSKRFENVRYSLWLIILKENFNPPGKAQPPCSPGTLCYKMPVYFRSTMVTLWGAREGDMFLSESCHCGFMGFWGRVPLHHCGLPGYLLKRLAGKPICANPLLSSPFPPSPPHPPLQRTPHSTLLTLV